jgi:hypothetical protein
MNSLFPLFPLSFFLSFFLSFLSLLLLSSAGAIDHHSSWHLLRFTLKNEGKKPYLFLCQISTGRTLKHPSPAVVLVLGDSYHPHSLWNEQPKPRFQVSIIRHQRSICNSDDTRYPRVRALRHAPSLGYDCRSDNITTICSMGDRIQLNIVLLPVLSQAIAPVSLACSPKTALYHDLPAWRMAAVRL